MGKQASPRALVVELCKQFYTQGWVSGTGGGISIRDAGKIYLAPSGVQKERIAEEDLYELDADGGVLCAPSDSRLTPSACQPLFFNAYRLRNAGAVIHSHAIHAMLVTLLYRERFECTQLEMIKGIGSFAVLVRRHGVYIWGKDWVQAKTHAECYHYLFEAAVQMAQLGLRADAPDTGARRNSAAPAVLSDERRLP
jgi:ribulose-5-phosphate 4-epimerase/fuculose-1-phosphate aldolase